MKITISSIIALFVYQMLFISLPYFDSYQKIIIPSLMLLIGIYILSNKQLISKEKYGKINNILFLFYISSIISALMNPKFFASCIYTTKILEAFYFFEIIESKKKLTLTLNMYTKLFFMYLVVSDFLLLFKPELYLINRTYFIGNKFYLIYHHILTILFLSINNNKNMLLYSLMIFSVFISFYIDCITGFIGVLLLSFCIIFINTNKVRKILNEKNILFILLFFCSILFVFSNIINNKIIITFIEMLNGDVTLTGRTRIYSNILAVLFRKPLLGYGYGNANYILMSTINAPNTQNGLLQCVLYFGIIGTILMLVLIYNIIKIYRKKNNNSNLIFYILVFSIIAVVEITIDIKFFGILAILNGLNHINSRENKI